MGTHYGPRGPVPTLRCHNCHTDHRLDEECPKGARNTYTPVHPRIAEHQDWMETDSRFAQPCPDLDDGAEPMDIPELAQEPWEANHKLAPLARGLLDYFPDALLAVANCSLVCTEQHTPGEPMHWAYEKSTDEADALMRHLAKRGKIDKDRVRHSAKVAWRALAMLQRELNGDST